ncbi:MAG: 6-hydroxymethylpterin diphosphokinase MptE-like protein [Euryarchaeota archaeon]|nr:6-hydroxymethylpterin diphosphokinase MptE-like protein [Euryarchaeota archaeon]
MRFEYWEPIYLEISEEFGFSRERDEEAARLLSLLLRSDQTISDQEEQSGLDAIGSIVRGRDVLVCGNAPCLARELDDVSPGYVMIAADGATTVLLEMGIVPEVIVTDLDGTVPDIIAANRRGSLVVVHAHGDNMAALREYVPQMSRVIGTTQSRPFDEIYNFGGFTDGDRCVFLARCFGASKIELAGFDYDDQNVAPMKKMKLRWAKRLVKMALDLPAPLRPGGRGTRLSPPAPARRHLPDRGLHR